MKLRVMARLLEIQRVLVRHGLDVVSTPSRCDAR
jgi:hypothetical protein